MQSRVARVRAYIAKVWANLSENQQTTVELVALFVLMAILVATA